MRWISVFTTSIMILSCFLPWITIDSKQITVTGIAAVGTGFGKPGYMHFFMAGMFITFLLIGKSWSQKIALFFAAVNLAWAIRNFILLPMCHGGVCPERHFALFVLLITSIMMIIFTLLTPLRQNNLNKKTNI